MRSCLSVHFNRLRLAPAAAKCTPWHFKVRLIGENMVEPSCTTHGLVRWTGLKSHTYNHDRILGLHSMLFQPDCFYINGLHTFPENRALLCSFNVEKMYTEA